MKKANCIINVIDEKNVALMVAGSGIQKGWPTQVSEICNGLLPGTLNGWGIGLFFQRRGDFLAPLRSPSCKQLLQVRWALRSYVECQLCSACSHPHLPSLAMDCCLVDHESCICSLISKDHNVLKSGSQALHLASLWSRHLRAAMRL